MARRKKADVSPAKAREPAGKSVEAHPREKTYVKNHA